MNDEEFAEMRELRNVIERQQAEIKRLRNGLQQAIEDFRVICIRASQIDEVFGLLGYIPKSEGNQ